jgi:hypothetical protein
VSKFTSKTDRLVKDERGMYVGIVLRFNKKVTLVPEVAMAIVRATTPAKPLAQQIGLPRASRPSTAMGIPSSTDRAMSD